MKSFGVVLEGNDEFSGTSATWEIGVLLSMISARRDVSEDTKVVSEDFKSPRAGRETLFWRQRKDFKKDESGLCSEGYILQDWKSYVSYVR